MLAPMQNTIKQTKDDDLRLKKASLTPRENPRIKENNPENINTSTHPAAEVSPSALTNANPNAAAIKRVAPNKISISAMVSIIMFDEPLPMPENQGLDSLFSSLRVPSLRALGLHHA